MKALVLDFDGVIFDSAPEAFVVALWTYAELFPDTRFIQLSKYLHNIQKLSIERIKNNPVYVRFVELMPLGNRAEDYGVILSILEREIVILDQASYDTQYQATSANFLDRFHTRFYQIRTQFYHSNPVRWRHLIAPYPAFVELLRQRHTDILLAIATAKDRSSVQRLLVDYKLTKLFPSERVLDKVTGVSKIAHITALHQILDCSYPEMTFMDDKVNHLNTVAPLQVRCALATWGYNSEREHRQARERGYLVCSLNSVEARLFG